MKYNIKSDSLNKIVYYVFEELKAVVERIRSMSPEYAQFIAKKS